MARDKDNGGLERPPGLQPLPDKGRSQTRQGARRLGALASGLWRLIRPLLAGTLQVLLALIIVFEEWGWRPLAEVLGRLAR